MTSSDNRSAMASVLSQYPVLTGFISSKSWYRPAANPMTAYLGLDNRPATEDDVFDVVANCSTDKGDLPYACAGLFLSLTKEGSWISYAQHVDDAQIDCDDADDVFVGWLIYRRSRLFDIVREVLEPLEALARAAGPCSADMMKDSSYISVTGHAWRVQAVVDKTEDASLGRSITVYDAADLIDMLEEARGAIGRDIVHGDVNGDSPCDTTDNVIGTVEYRVIRRWLSQFFPERFKGEHPDEGEGYSDDEEFENVYADYGFARA